MVVGTVGYMSPEQAIGSEVDFRSDQFSFGSVLYEMVTGVPVFRKNTDVETLAAILRDEPLPLATRMLQVPTPLIWIVERCLAKDPQQRYASTKDLARDLAAVRDRLAHVPGVPAEPRPKNLPLQHTAFIGRDQEEAELRQLLAQEKVRLVTLTGPGGIGKTRLALKAVNDIADRFPGGVCFVSLSEIDDGGLIASTIVQALGVSESGTRTPQESLKEYVGRLDQAMLLLLDNFEHLTPAASFMAELLSAGPRLKVVVTSQSRLHVYGEYEFPVSPLALPDLKSIPPLESLSRLPAIALFVERAQAIKPGFTLTKENAATVATICARLDGLPLAIELAAARIKLLSPTTMLARLESSLDLLTGGARDLPSRQQTLRSTVDWSYGLLTSAEQTLFRRLSVFSGGCTLEAVEACVIPEAIWVSIPSMPWPRSWTRAWHSTLSRWTPKIASLCSPPFVGMRSNGLPKATMTPPPAEPMLPTISFLPKRARRRCWLVPNGSIVLRPNTIIFVPPLIIWSKAGKRIGDCAWVLPCSASGRRVNILPRAEWP